MPITKTKARATIESLSDEIVEVETMAEKMFMAPDDFEIAKSLETPSKPVVWFLPYEDHLAKAFIDRTWYLSNDNRSKLLPHLREHYWPPDVSIPTTIATKATNTSGEIRPSIWIDGEIVGRWELEEDEGTFSVVYKLYRKVRPKYGNMIPEKARELEDFVNTRLVPISKSK